jgi:putative Ca2+/H+ antiporter (TMEM165/GDT1 family)
MDAIMIALVAVALANADGRTGSFLAALLALRDDRRVVFGLAVGAFVVNAVVAAIAGSVANAMIGQGIIMLLVGFALVSGAAALLWPGRLGPDAESLARAPLPLLGARMLLSQFGDRSHFLIGALAATSGAGHWAAAGGLAGWILAMLPFLAFGPALAERRAAKVVRWIAAAVLIVWGLRSAMTAFGILGQ